MSASVARPAAAIKKEQLRRVRDARPPPATERSSCRRATIKVPSGPQELAAGRVSARPTRVLCNY